MKIVIHTLILALVCAAVVIPAYARQVYSRAKLSARIQRAVNTGGVAIRNS